MICCGTPKAEWIGIRKPLKFPGIVDRSTKSAEINVETFKGVVQLSGFVSSQDAVNKAVAVTRTVGGVKSVKNDMRLK